MKQLEPALKRAAAFILAIALTFGMLISGAAPAFADGGPADGGSGRAIWINDDRETTYETLQEAVAAAPDGASVHVQGDFSSEPAKLSGTVSRNIDLVVSGDTTVKGGSGIIIDSGSAVRCENGATLRMTDSNTPLTIRAGASMNDGNYVFSNVRTGLSLLGEMRGTSRSALDVRIDAASDCTGLQTGTGTVFRNATVIWNGGGRNGYDYRNIDLDNVDMTVKDVWLYPYPAFRVNNSNFSISGRFNPNGMTGGHVLAIIDDRQKTDAVVTNSNITVSGSRVNVVSDRGLTLNDSTMTVKDSSDGGFNVNYGSTLNVNNSTLRADNVKGGFIVAGYSGRSNLHIDGSSVIETAASSDGDAVGVNGSYTVTGGTHKTYMKPGYESRQTPTNGEANGNEKLTLFKLADPSVTSLELVNKNGGTYTYNVARANDDGQKRVWAPAEKVTFTLNEGDETVDAMFGDGSSEDRTVPAMRGYAVGAASEADGEKTYVLDEPTAAGFRFTGWYYRDDSGEHKFDVDKTAVTAPLTVYAKWEKTETKSVVYHKNKGGSDVRYISSSNDGTGEQEALSYDAVVRKNSKFKAEHWRFTSWNTKADGTGEKIMPGEKVKIPDGEKTVSLYAQYEPVLVTVKVSANGGKFRDDSIFKTQSDLFTVKTDKAGGETAVLNKKVQDGSRLSDALEDAGIEVSSFTGSGSPFATREYFKQKSRGFLSLKWYYLYNEPEALSPVYSSDVINGDTTYYVGWDFDPSSGAEEVKDFGLELRGDILSDGDTASDHVYFVKPGQELEFTGNLDITPIKEQISQLAMQYEHTGNSIDTIKTSGVSSTFKAVFSVPEGVSLKDVKAELDKTDVFSIPEDGVEISSDGSKVTVTMTLNKNYEKFSDLHRDITGMSDELNVTLTGVRTDDSIEPGSRLRITGEVTGDFTGLAVTESGKARYYNFRWDTVQNDEGRDYRQSSSDDTIAFTLGVPSKISQDGDLPGDILFGTGSGADTQHESTYKMNAGDTVDITGRLTVTPIKNRIGLMADRHEGDDSSIKTKDIESGFKAVLKLPDGMKFTDDVRAELSDTSVFEIPDGGAVFDRDAGTLTVTMVLKKDYSRFTDLKADIDRVPDDLDIKVYSVKTDSSLSAGTTLRIDGEVTGWFRGMAYTADSAEDYDFTWTAYQDPEGSDSTLPADTRLITATAEIAGGNEPEQPEDTRSASYTVTAHKTVDGKTPTQGHFIIALKNEDDGTVKYAETDDQGLASFESLSFTSEDIGRTYRYTVYEVSGTELYIYDTRKYELVLTPQDDSRTGGMRVDAVITCDGETVDSILFNNVSVKSDKPDEPDDPGKPDNKPVVKPDGQDSGKGPSKTGADGSTPRTGDSTDMSAAAVLIASAAGLAAALALRFRKKADR